MVELGGLGIQASGLVSTVIYALVGIVIIAAVAVGVYYLINFLKYKYKVVIFSKRGNGIKTVYDKGAMIKTKDDIWYLRLLKHKTMIKPPDNKFISSDNTIYLRHLGEDLYFPFNLNFDDKTELITIENIDYDETLTWFFSFKKLIKEKYAYKDFLEHYMPIISVSVIMFVFLIGVYFMSKNITEYLAFGQRLISAGSYNVPPA